MTKAVRIENADTSEYKVLVRVWQKQAAGDVMVREVLLGHPTAMETLGIHSGQYLVVLEADQK